MAYTYKIKRGSTGVKTGTTATDEFSYDFPENTGTTDIEYTITVEDDSGCTATTPVTVSSGSECQESDECVITNIVSTDGEFISDGLDGSTYWAVEYEVTVGSQTTSGNGEAKFVLSENTGTNDRNVCIGDANLAIDELIDENGDDLLDTCSVATGICFTQEGRSGTSPSISCPNLKFRILSSGSTYFSNISSQGTYTIPKTSVVSGTFTIEPYDTSTLNKIDFNNATGSVTASASTPKYGNNPDCGAGGAYWYNECQDYGTGANCGCTGGTSGTSNGTTAEICQVSAIGTALSEQTGSRSRITVNDNQFTLSLPTSYSGYLNDCCPDDKVAFELQFKFEFGNGTKCGVGVDIKLA